LRLHADRPEGDQHRVETLRSHDALFRSKEFIAGSIFFCYNDYRSHVGPPVRERCGKMFTALWISSAAEPSYAVLREECSPIESLVAETAGTRSSYGSEPGKISHVHSPWL